MDINYNKMMTNNGQSYFKEEYVLGLEKELAELKRKGPMSIRLIVKTFIWRTKHRWGVLRTLYRFYRAWRLMPDMRFWQVIDYLESQQKKIQSTDDLFNVNDGVTRSILKDWAKS